MVRTLASSSSFPKSGHSNINLSPHQSQPGDSMRILKIIAYKADRRFFSRSLPPEVERFPKPFSYVVSSDADGTISQKILECMGEDRVGLCTSRPELRHLLGSVVALSQLIDEAQKADTDTLVMFLDTPRMIRFYNSVRDSSLYLHRVGASTIGPAYFEADIDVDCIKASYS